MVVSRARTLRWAPRLICFSLSSANQRSTRLSQEALVGVKWTMKSRMAHEPPSHARRFVRPVVVEDQMHVEIRGHAGVDRLEELQELLAPMPAMTLADDLARRDIQRGKQRGCAMAAIVVRPALGRAERHRQHRCGAVQAWIWLFSSTLNTNARSGGARYKPTMSRTFSTKSGSRESLNVSLRCGCRPNARQMRPTVA